MRGTRLRVMCFDPLVRDDPKRVGTQWPLSLDVSVAKVGLEQRPAIERAGVCGGAVHDWGSLHINAPSLASRHSADARGTWLGPQLSLGRSTCFCAGYLGRLLICHPCELCTLSNAWCTSRHMTAELKGCLCEVARPSVMTTSDTTWHSRCLSVLLALPGDALPLNWHREHA